MAIGSPGSDDCPTVGGMPKFGLGTYRNDDHRQCVRTVETALEIGYRQVDTAQMYRNERAVGEAIRAADVPREDIFVATKVWHDRLTYADVIESVEASLDRLGLSYLDLLYVHWPANTYDPEETLPAFDDLVDDGAVDRVGLSNFTRPMLDEAASVLDSQIFALQVEMHPLFPQESLRAYCAEHDIQIVAYAPLARTRVSAVDVLTTIADRYGASAAQVSLAWLRQMGVTAIPKATGEDHLRENWESLTLTLDEEDMAAIDGIDDRERIVSPAFGPW